MKDDKKVDLEGIKNLKNRYVDLKEKILITLKEKKELLQAKCKQGIKKAGDFIRAHKNAALNTLKAVALITAICFTAISQYMVTMNKEEAKFEKNQSQYSVSVVQENPDYALSNINDMIIGKKDYFETNSENKNTIEGLKGFIECVNSFQYKNVRQDIDTDKSDPGSDLGDKYEIMTAVAKKLKQLRRNKERKELAREENTSSLSRKMETSENSIHGNDMDKIAIIEEYDDKLVNVEEIDIDGDGIKDKIYNFNYEDNPYYSIINNEGKERIDDVDDYSR